jgi:hypothetical protein
MLNAHTIYLISVDQYFPTYKEIREMAQILHTQECSKEVSVVTAILLDVNAQIGRA